MNQVSNEREGKCLKYIQKFQEFHNEYLKKNHIVHVYAEPKGGSEPTDPAAMWFFVMSKKRDLIDNGFKDYIHPEGDYFNGYWDHCSIEKGTFDYDNMKPGEIFPAILYAHHETLLTVACVIGHHDDGDEKEPVLYIYYPNEEGLDYFYDHRHWYHPDDKF